MNIANEYKRSFLYFVPEDKSFDNGPVPSGFVSFEIRNGRGKLTAFIENLSDTSQKYEYKLYLISCREALTIPVFVANIKLIKNKSQVNWVFDASNVGGSKLRLEDFDVVAVIVVNEKRNASIISPLVAYIGSKIEWKNKLKDVLYIEKIEERTKFNTKQEHELASHITQTGNIEHEMEIKQAEQKGQAEQTIVVNAVDATSAKTVDSKLESNSDLKQDTKNCENSDCIKSSTNKRNNDKFTSAFDKYLERCNPFNSDRKDYVWWRAGSTYYLNTILYWINLRTPIMLNPAVFNAACKHGHLLAGIYTNDNNEKYLVFGIPGKFGTEMQPFGGLGRWAQADIRKPEYDAFGYWLIYMDPNTARVIE